MQVAAAEGGRRARLHRAWELREGIFGRRPLRRARGLEVATAKHFSRDASESVKGSTQSHVQTKVDVDVEVQVQSCPFRSTPLSDSNVHDVPRLGSWSPPQASGIPGLARFRYENITLSMIGGRELRRSRMPRCERDVRPCDGLIVAVKIAQDSPCNERASA
jgi:hypothetical protein